MIIREMEIGWGWRD